MHGGSPCGGFSRSVLWQVAAEKDRAARVEEDIVARLRRLEVRVSISAKSPLEDGRSIV